MPSYTSITSTSNNNVMLLFACGNYYKLVIIAFVIRVKIPLKVNMYSI